MDKAREILRHKWEPDRRITRRPKDLEPRRGEVALPRVRIPRA